MFAEDPTQQLLRLLVRSDATEADYSSSNSFAAGTDIRTDRSDPTMSPSRAVFKAPDRAFAERSPCAQVHRQKALSGLLWRPACRHDATKLALRAVARAPGARPALDAPL